MMEGNAVPILRELSAKLNVPEHEFFAALADLLAKHGDIKGETVLVDTRSDTLAERAERKEYDPAFASVVDLPDFSAEEAAKLGSKIGERVWGIPLLHLHTEYVAKALIGSILSGGETSRVFIPSAIITLTAALEAAIGEATFQKCRALLGQACYKAPAEAICKLGPLQRLEALVPFASKGELVLRQAGSKSITLIRGLFPLRNNLMHQNLEYLEFTVTPPTGTSATYGLDFPPALSKRLARMNLDNTELEAYWNAYLGLKASFLRTDAYREDDYLEKPSR
jgi:hypothetical protein